MTPEALINEVYANFVATAYIAGPPLVISTVVGVVVSLLQAVTQIQDQTLGQSIKIATIASFMVFMGGKLTSSLYERTIFIFDHFQSLVR